MPAKVESSLALPGLSPVAGKRIIARFEASAQGTDSRFIVTNLAGGTARTLYETLHCRRGQAENHIKSWKIHLAADRTSCQRGAAIRQHAPAHVHNHHERQNDARAGHRYAW